MSNSSIDLLGERIADTLAEFMVDAVSDETQAGFVRTGRLQEDPSVEFKITINRGGKDWPDQQVTRQNPYHAAPFTMPGGAAWLRRFVITYQLHFDTEDRRDSKRIAAVIASRTRYAIERMDMDGTSDDFGEVPLIARTVRFADKEGGGPGHFIWDGEHRVEILCETEGDV